MSEASRTISMVVREATLLKGFDLLFHPVNHPTVFARIA